MKIKKRDGSAYLLVIGALIFVTLMISLTVNRLHITIDQQHASELQMQAYYFNKEAADTAVAVLLSNDTGEPDPETGATGDVYHYTKMSFPVSDTMEHIYGGSTLGKSELNIKKETHEYYEESKDWIVVDVKTTIPDPRAAHRGEDFTYTGKVMILEDNPLIKIYNIDPA